MRLERRTFRNSLSNIRTTIYDFFVAECLFARPKVSSFARAAWNWQKRSLGKSKLTRSEGLTIEVIKIAKLRLGRSNQTAASESLNC